MTNPTFAALGAAALKQMDRSRQARGKLFERVGYGPEETPFTVLYSEPGVNLRRYGEATAAATANAPAVLLVPAPIKRCYIWDLAPDISVVRRWIEAGYRVYLAEWTPLPDEQAGFGLDDYGDRLLGACRAAIQADGGQERVTLAGHSLGGILAAIHSGLHPDSVDATVLLESPLHFGAESCCFRKLVDATPDAAGIAAAFGQVPGVFLNIMSAIAEPQAFQWERGVDRWMSLADPALLRKHLRVERWTHDEFPLPGRLFTELVERLYRRDEFFQGQLPVGGRRLGPQALRAPLVSVVDRRSKLIPEAAMVPFHEAAGSSARLLLNYDGDIGVNLQHVGILVGRSAHARIWPAIFDWLRQQPRGA